MKHVCKYEYANCYDKSDEHNQLCGCTESKPWPCIDGDGCIEAENVCDGFDDCNDKSDEVADVCVKWNCTGLLWKCHYSMKCVEINVVCDGKTDCTDTSDEDDELCINFKCLEGTTKCADGKQCIANNTICDNEVHCSDASDELCTAPCLNIHSNEKNIIKRCSEQNDMCLPVDRYCDGFADCPYGSDEADSDCSCSDWNLVTCQINGTSFCIHPLWIEVNGTTSGEAFLCDHILFSVKDYNSRNSK